MQEEMFKEIGFDYLAYPFGAYTNDAVNALAQSSIKLAFDFRDYTYARRTDNKYHIKRIKISDLVSWDDFVKLFQYGEQ